MNDKGGIIVRQGEAISSSKLPERLATGAIVEELELVGERLHYRKLMGSGPTEGWVGIKLSNRELLKKSPCSASKQLPPATVFPALASPAALPPSDKAAERPEAAVPALSAPAALPPVDKAAEGPDAATVAMGQDLMSKKWEVIAKPWVPFREFATRHSKVVGAAVPGQVLSFLDVQFCPIYRSPYGRFDWVDKKGSAISGWISVDLELVRPVRDGIASAALATLEGVEHDHEMYTGDLVVVLSDFLSMSDSQTTLHRGQLGIVRECHEGKDLPALIHFDHQHECENEWVAKRDFGSLRVMRSEVSVDMPQWPKLAAESLCRNGFCLVRSGSAEGLAPNALCVRCAKAAQNRLRELTNLATRLGLDPTRDIIEYAEICARAEGCLRYDLSLSVDRPGANVGAWREEDAEAWAQLHACMDRWAQPVLLASGLLRACDSSTRPQGGVSAEGEDGRGVFDRSGCVTSLPGAPEQDYHQDGDVRTSSGLINAFMPLVPISMQNGPTQFLPFAVPPRTLMQEDIPPIAPTPGRGDLLLFDYRVFHKGLANDSAQPRPVAYIVYARPGLSDKHNFPTERLEKW